MTKSELIEALAKKQRHLTLKDVDLAVGCIIEHMCQTLIANDRVEVRGFGGFLVALSSCSCRTKPKNWRVLKFIS